MTKLKNFFSQNLRLILAVLSGVFVISGILVVAFGGGDSEGWLKAVIIVFGVTLILIGCTILAMAAAFGNGEKANFFLYDSKRKANVSIDELDFARVDKKMMKIMTKVASNASEVWTNNVFDRYDEVFEGDDAFKPLIAYKIIYDLGEHSNESVWNLFLLADASIIDSLVAALEENDDHDLGDAFKFLHKNSAGSYERTAKFLEDNRKYIQNKMVKYVKSNINRF